MFLDFIAVDASRNKVHINLISGSFTSVLFLRMYGCDHSLLLHKPYAETLKVENTNN